MGLSRMVGPRRLVTCVERNLLRSPGGCEGVGIGGIGPTVDRARRSIRASCFRPGDRAHDEPAVHLHDPKTALSRRTLQLRSNRVEELSGGVGCVNSPRTWISPSLPCQPSCVLPGTRP